MSNDSRFAVEEQAGEGQSTPPAAPQFGLILHDSLDTVAAEAILAARAQGQLQQLEAWLETLAGPTDSAATDR